MRIKRLYPCELCKFNEKGKCHAYDDWIDPEYDPCINARRRDRYMTDEEKREFIKENENVSM